MKVNRHDQAKILSPQAIAWLFDGKLGLVSDLKLFQLLVWLVREEEFGEIASMSMLSYLEGLPTERDRALFEFAYTPLPGICRCHFASSL